MTHTRNILDALNKADVEGELIDRVKETTVAESDYDELSWFYDERRYDELLQVTDAYVVHARGFTVEDQIVLDEYALNGGHKRWWQQKLADEFDRDWRDDGPNQVLYWSITGSGTFTIQYPGLAAASVESIGRVKQTWDAMGVPDDAQVGWLLEIDGQPSWRGLRSETDE